MQTKYLVSIFLCYFKYCFVALFYLTNIFLSLRRRKYSIKSHSPDFMDISHVFFLFSVTLAYCSILKFPCGLMLDLIDIYMLCILPHTLCRHCRGLQASLPWRGAQRPQLWRHEEGGVCGPAETQHPQQMVLRPSEYRDETSRGGERTS